MMAYNGFNYPQYPQPQVYSGYQQFAPQIPSQQQGIIWIQGKNAALSYPVAAGQSAILMDSDGPYVYKKETAPDGRPLPMETYRLVKEDGGKAAATNDEVLNQYVKKEQIESILNDKLGKMETFVKQEVERRMAEFSFKPTRTKVEEG